MTGKNRISAAPDQPLVLARLWVKSVRSFVALARPLIDLVARMLLSGALIAGALTQRDVGGAGVFVIGPLLGLAALMLAAGFMTRTIALVALIALATLQASAGADDSRLFQILLYAWLVVHGAGLFSLDALFRAGIARSALSPAALAVHVSQWLTDRGASVLLVLLRTWLAMTWLVIALNEQASQQWDAVLPVNTFAIAPPALALVAGGLAIIGAAMPMQLGILVIAMLGYAAGNLMQGLEVTGIDPLALLVCAVPAVFGSGGWSVDGWLEGWLQRHVLYERDGYEVPETWPHVVVVGAGFGGLAATTRLARLPVRVTLIDRQNYHLFQPLLYQIATASLSPSDIALSIRSLFRRDRNVTVLLGEVTGIDTAQRSVLIGERRIAYDRLVLATGARHSYFGRDEWAPWAPGLKRVEDGVRIRARVLRAFEQAEATLCPEERQRMLTFVVVGGGPTGVELAGAIAEMAAYGLAGEFRAIDPRTAKVVLLHAGARVLPSFPEVLSREAMAALGALGVDVRTKALVTGIGADHVLLGDQRIAAGTVIWAAGVAASSAGSWLGARCDPAGRVFVREDLSVPGHPEIFVIGDTAASTAWNGAMVPGIAPAAKQAGQHVARVIRAELSGDPPPPPFAYRHRGDLATIGRKHAVAQIGAISFAGAPAWWLWGAVHVGYLAGARNRTAVLLNWVWSYFTLRSNVTLITDGEADPRAD